MDSLRFHWRESFFNHPRFSEDFWNPDMSWHNKYKERGHTWLANFIEEIDNTALVFLTDGWHMMQWLMITSVALSIVLVNPIALGTWQSTLALAIVFRFVPFHIGFFISYYLMRRKEQ